MATRSVSAILHGAVRVVDPGSDGELVRRFVEERDAGAFRHLVDRHGPMVLAVCRRVTRHRQDAEDAFQAVFLVLARKAGALRHPGHVGGWLHGVATRAAAKVRSTAARRRRRETALVDGPAAPDRDRRCPVLDAEVARLPEKYRTPVVLCELSGVSLKDAAAALGVPLGTVASRLARGRARLAARLRRYSPDAVGLSLAAVVLPVAPAVASAAAALPFGPVPARVLDLSHGVIRDMFLRKLMTTAVGFVALVASAAAGLTVLADAGAANFGPAAAPNNAAGPAPVTPTRQPGPFTGNPADAAKLVADGNDAFGLDLYGVLAADSQHKAKNLFFSPFSMEAALGMTAAGASGDALTELQTGLHLPKDEAATDAGFGHLFDAINAPNTPAEKRGYQLSTANAIYAQKGERWSKAFVDRVAGKYGAGVVDADFKSDANGERKRINRWVEDQTNHKIKDLLAPPTVTELTVMVLVNAVYFKGDWAAGFSKDLTRDGPFTRGDGSRVTAKLMRREGEYALHEDPAAGFRALELPYRGGQLAMVVVLPDTADGLPAVEKALTPGKLAGITAAFAEESGAGGGHREKVNVLLPKFKVETCYEMIEPLRKLGMKAMFDSHGLQRLTTSRNDFNVSAVVHKGFVDVNEEGTEAAAATAVVVIKSFPSPKRSRVFSADHPFLFAIVHKPTNAVLFLGRVEDPVAQ
ncbi:serine protease inhibitor : Putative uncharacterized protein OS=Branchiostoma floridae GN=BRAFLDRAFT_130749 PE=3 SV=1: Sigma70_r2: Sigma70_r4_2: Serpin [Gemmataceae bacterium]|nr:serine protease inhibitor : Putative uncharacterized protein OS=Branchiostoma floridae GN=BRAFLDRAFT_130749 PE=3 SV=1: Sigma70_r2: Sigma70_r4_2: Serpin [Gemmataceae bacterium]VTU02549.1 serine protease inhibitor : Putative uncharacterized protein OS=Branchiostoma floridae GN=BRAFLDRAFT_130749 PE=3 SV=1: Sigma70_r2: Sigma70_r4_2: Serpin [Gemmataceae bacterium]